jgi:2',3'-cyclic-nucleotide 2'-phosphodiesterase/3'-nucleotidase
VNSPFSCRRRALLLLLAWCIAGWPAAAERVTVVVLATTDLHGNILPLDLFTNRPEARGLAKIAELVRRERAEHPNALLIDCGDTIEGSPLEYVHQREVRKSGKAAPPDPMMLVMNYLHYHAMVVGNHEFNFGLPVLWKARREADFPWLSANVTPAATEEEALAVKKRRFEEAADLMGERTFDPTLFAEVNGARVAVIGLTTLAIPRWEPPENVSGYKFESPLDAARYWTRYARQVRQADVVILAVHSGLERDPETGGESPGQLPGENAAYQLAAGTNGVDAIVFGHTHREVPQLLINGVLLVQPKNFGGSLAELTFVLERESPEARWKLAEKRARLIPVTSDTPADPKVLEIAKPYQQAAERYLATPVAEAAVPLQGTLGRVTDTALVRAIQEAQLGAAKADVSFTALFDPSVSIPKGPVRVRDLARLYAYDNTLYALELTGGQIKEALEHSARYFNQYRAGQPDSGQPDSGQPGPLINPKVFGFNYDMAAGVTYKIDLSRPAGSRIVDLRFKGQPLAPERKLRVAVNSYRKSGGGGYTVFQGAPVLWQSATDVRQLMIDYYTRKKVIGGPPASGWQIVPEDARQALIKEVQSPEKKK